MTNKLTGKMVEDSIKQAREERRQRKVAMENATNKLVRLCKELDEEADGVKVPRALAALLNAIRATLEEIDELVPF